MSAIQPEIDIEPAFGWQHVDLHAALNDAEIDRDSAPHAGSSGAQRLVDGLLRDLEVRSAPGNADAGKPGKRAAAVHDDGTSGDEIEVARADQHDHSAGGLFPFDVVSPIEGDEHHASV